MPNRLALETSPYLLQHKDNPVDWWPWGEDALSEARRRDLPVLLSVGYAACHWCHVMEHESFEDDATAALMNEKFVCIKVDREERPDIDSIYMDAVQAMTGQGGWPMTVFLTPEATPFYGGTYFPNEDRHGMPAFRRVLTAISEAWEQRRDQLEQQGTKLVEHLGAAGRLMSSNQPIAVSLLDAAFEHLKSAYDPMNGGFGAAPKFPQPMNLDFLLHLAARGHEEAEEMATHSLLRMSAGGMFDQLGGGFARYSVDASWTVPHFEKMLYDNALLLRTYTRAWLVTDLVRFSDVARATAEWMLTEMRDPGGGLWSSLDADSEGVEGKFYVWTLDEVEEVAGSDAGTVVEHFGITEHGNFEGANILVYAREPNDVDALIRAHAGLLERRGGRVRPATDSKVLTSWNSLAAAALAEAGAALGHRDWVDAAREVMDFVLSTLRVGGRLMRSYRSGRGGGTVKHLGCCEDYAFALEACLSLYEATFDVRWIDEARWCADEAIRLFLDEEAGGFYTTGSDGERLVVRPKDLYDNAIPSANSVLALELQRLALTTGESSYEGHALGAMSLLAEVAARSPLGFGHLLCAMDFYLSEPLEVVITGNERDRLTSVVRAEFLPNKVLISSGAPDEDAQRIPLLRGRASRDGATAYVCRRGTCKLPVKTPEALLEQLRRS